jgi:pimeloyl-ACP methyl ester carboxylesterase
MEHAMKPSTNATRAASRRTIRHVALCGILTILLGAVIAYDAPRTGPPVAVAAQSDVAGLVNIGDGRRMYLECRGQGSPTVVLESGYGNSGVNWSIESDDVPQPQVLPAVAGFTRVCAYDRPGTVGLDLDDHSRSDPVPQPRTAPAVVADLHALLQAAGVPGPYVLVGHSLGGMFVRLYAHTYPEEVVGLVLVDARPDGLYAPIERRLTPDQWTALKTFLAIAVVPEGSPNDPFASARQSGLEFYDTTPFNDLLREAARATPLRPMPLAVLASGRQWPGTAADFLGIPPETLFATWRAGQEVLATILPQARFFVAGESGHDIYLEQPALVTEAIRQVVAGVRDPDTWEDLVACCTP